ncbi:MAG TPA: hypothetical protein VGD61_13870 [Pyrinomonadaceae bacterium]
MKNVIADSDDPNIAAVLGTQTGDGGTGVLGIGPANGVIGQSTGSGFSGVFGESATGPGVSGSSTSSVGIDAKTQSGPAAVRGVHAGNGPGVFGLSKKNGIGVHGVCEGSGFSGVFGESKTGPGVSAASNSSVGIDAKTQSGPAAVRAIHAGNGPGILGVSRGKGEGVHGVCEGSGFSGVFGESKTGPGVSGSSATSVGVDAKSQSGPAALRAVHGSGGFAGVFGGHVHISRDLKVDGDVQLTGADLAEQFGVIGEMVPEPGSVVVLVGNDQVSVSEEAYDHRVGGIVSGAGNYRPGIVLDRQPDANRCALALSGKVWCKVDADFSPVEVGDLLTTSSTPGHAMRATDPARAFGAVIGKALGSLQSGRALVPVLVALQ